MVKPEEPTFEQPVDPYKQRLEQVLQNKDLGKDKMVSQAIQILLEKNGAVKEVIDAEKAQFESAAEEARAMIDMLKKQLTEQTEQALAEIHQQSEERQAKLKVERDALDQRDYELNELEGLLEKWQNANTLYGKWKNGTVAQSLIAHYLIGKWRDKYKVLYETKKKVYDEKWEKE